MRRMGLVAVLVAACGSDPAQPDAAQGLDATGDPAPIDVAVHAAPGDAEPSVVYFIAPDGTTQKVPLDVYGHAKAISPAGTWVLVAHYQSQFIRRIDAYGGIAPGMAISDLVTFAPQAPMQAMVSVPHFDGAAYYGVFTSCFGLGGVSDPAGGLVTVMAVDCAQKADGNVVAVAQDAAMHEIGYAWVQHADLTKPVTVPALQPTSTLTATFAHLPFAPQQPGTQGQVWLQQGSDLSSLATSATDIALGADSATFSAPIAPVGDHTRVQVQIASPDSYVAYAKTLPGISALTIDASTMPRLPHGRTVVGSTISWTEDAAGATPVMVSAYASWTTTTSMGKLYAYAPYSGTSLTLPAFPAELGVVLDQQLMQTFSLISTDAPYAQLVSEGFYAPRATWTVSF